MEDTFAAFHHKYLNELLNVLIVAERENISAKELKIYLAELRTDRLKVNIECANKSKEAKERWENTAPRCPLCGDGLSIRSLVNCGKANPRGYKSHWYCDSSLESTCLYERYSMETYEQELKNIGWEE